MITVKMFPASEGDAFLVSIESCDGIKNILIDMGRERTYDDKIKNELLSINSKGQEIDLLVITHVDTDHIEGAVKFFHENTNNQIVNVKEIWHNSYRHLSFDNKITGNAINTEEKEQLIEIKNQNNYDFSNNDIDDIKYSHGSTLASLLYEYGNKWNQSTNGRAICTENLKEYKIANINIKLLSPNDNKLKNISNHWRKYLNSLKYDFCLDDNQIFDDAYELYLRNLEDEKNENVGISFSSKKVDEFNIESLLEANGKDRSPTNGSSISFIIEAHGKKLLFLGDAHKDLITESLQVLKKEGYELVFDLVKLSHHGSINNISKKMFELMKSKRYLISTNGKMHKHPNIETLAILFTGDWEKEIITNYDIERISNLKNKELEKKYNYKINTSNTISVQ